MKRLLIMALIAVFAVACGGSRDADTSADDDTTEADDGAAEGVAESDDADEAAADGDAGAGELAEGEEGDDLPTPEDFEEEAEGSITAESLEAELDALEAEIGLDDDFDDDD